MRIKSLIIFAACVCLMSCHLITPRSTSHSHSQRSYLSSDVTIDCGCCDVTDCCDDSGAVVKVGSNGDTEHSVFMRKGQTLWVGANILAEYEPLSNQYSKELVDTYLMCGHETEAIPTRKNQLIQSRSGVNHWKINGQGSRKVTTHYTKAIYEAKEDGMHTCWVVYACKPKSGSTVRFKKDKSYLTYYPVDAYPGVNWIVEGDHLVNSTATHTPGGSRIWDAGLTTQSDSEIVVYWSPRLTNCEYGDEQCGDDFKGIDADTYFDWRIVLYQYSGGTVCNKHFGKWNKRVICKHHDHHCDRVTYREVFPIVIEEGSEEDCGSTTAHRRFKVYTQIRKSSNIYSDIMVQNSASVYSNILVYSR